MATGKTPRNSKKGLERSIRSLFSLLLSLGLGGLLLGAFGLGVYMPVSYTHLDVYKRQG